MTTATLPSRDQLAGAADILCMGIGWLVLEGGVDGNLEGCFDVVVDEGWKLMMMFILSVKSVPYILLHDSALQRHSECSLL